MNVLRTVLRTAFDYLSRAMVGDDGTDRHGTLASVMDAVAFFTLVGIACILTTIYAFIVGAI